MQIGVVKDFTFGFDYENGDSDDDDDDDVTGVQILQPHNVHTAGVHSSHHFYDCGLLRGMDNGGCLPSE